MKAFQQVICCECGWNLASYFGNEGDPNFVQCENSKCRHHGVKYRLPTVELEPVEDATARDRELLLANREEPDFPMGKPRRMDKGLVPVEAEKPPRVSTMPMLVEPGMSYMDYETSKHRLVRFDNSDVEPPQGCEIVCCAHEQTVWFHPNFRGIGWREEIPTVTQNPDGSLSYADGYTVLMDGSVRERRSIADAPPSKLAAEWRDRIVTAGVGDAPDLADGERVTAMNFTRTYKSGEPLKEPPEWLDRIVIPTQGTPEQIADDIVRQVVKNVEAEIGPIPKPSKSLREHLRKVADAGGEDADLAKQTLELFDNDPLAKLRKLDSTNLDDSLIVPAGGNLYLLNGGGTVEKIGDALSEPFTIPSDHKPGDNVTAKMNEDGSVSVRKDLPSVCIYAGTMRDGTPCEWSVQDDPANRGSERTIVSIVDSGKVRDLRIGDEVYHGLQKMQVKKIERDLITCEWDDENGKWVTAFRLSELSLTPTAVLDLPDGRRLIGVQREADQKMAVGVDVANPKDYGIGFWVQPHRFSPEENREAPKPATEGDAMAEFFKSRTKL